MPGLQKDFQLKNYTTFQVDARAKYFLKINSIDGLRELMDSDILSQNSYLILGGGSNILFTSDYDGIVLKVNLKGRSLVSEEQDCYYLKAYAGENWHELVCYCIANNYYGAENLSLIPGEVGAAPVQNIGAYGVELKDIFHSLEAFNLETGEIRSFSEEDCKFGYRDSIFKHEANKSYLILSVTLKLDRDPVFNIEYGAISEELRKNRIKEITAKAISEAVIKIRSSKLPDPSATGSAGSFFKNPELDVELFSRLKQADPGLDGFLLQNGKYKISAGRLIEKCGFRGMRRGDAGVYEKQALVLVNHGNATGKEILMLAEDIKVSVMEKFGVLLEDEVRII